MVKFTSLAIDISLIFNRIHKDMWGAFNIHLHIHFPQLQYFHILVFSHPYMIIGKSNHIFFASEICILVNLQRRITVLRFEWNTKINLSYPSLSLILYSISFQTRANHRPPPINYHTSIKFSQSHVDKTNNIFRIYVEYKNDIKMSTEITFQGIN